MAGETYSFPVTSRDLSLVSSRSETITVSSIVRDIDNYGKVNETLIKPAVTLRKMFSKVVEYELTHDLVHSRPGFCLNTVAIIVWNQESMWVVLAEANPSKHPSEWTENDIIRIPIL